MSAEQKQHSELREALAIAIEDVLLIDSPEGDSPRNIAANLREVLAELDNLEEQLEALRELGQETSTFLFEWPLDGTYESQDEAKEDMRDLRVRWLHALGIPTPGVSSPASEPEAS